MSKGTHSKRRVFTVTSAMAILASVSFTYGVDVAVDALVAPRPAGVIPQRQPRGVGIPGLYDAANRVETRPLDVPRLMQEDAARPRPGALPIGVVQDLGRVSSRDSGRWTRLKDGGWLWTMSIHAPGAVEVGLHVDPWEPPSGAELYIYNPNNPVQAVGPFTEDFPFQTLWTPTIYGDEANLEYYLPPSADHTARASQIAVHGLVNIYRGPDGGEPQGRTCHGNCDCCPACVPCQLDVTCFPAWQLQADGVGRVTFFDAGAGRWRTCSGSLINRVPEDRTPLFLTAAHCRMDRATPGTIQVRWFFQTTTCTGTPPATFPTTLGLLTLVERRGAGNSDIRLLGLDSGSLGGVTFNGWDNRDWANGNSGTGIHHPGGTFKRISIGIKTGTGVACGARLSHNIFWPQGNGVTEGGSSGSPIFDASGRIRGVLTGCGPCDCNDDNWDRYGRFDTPYNHLEPYLDPVDPIFVDGAHTGGEEGTVSNPFDTLIEGVFAVIAGSTVHIEAGSYDGSLTIDKAMTLRSRNGSVTIGQ